MTIFWLSIFVLTLIALAFIFKPIFLARGATLENSSWLMLCPLFILPLLALALYFYLGDYVRVAEKINSDKNATRVRAEVAKLGSRQNIIRTLHARLMQLPENKSAARGWFILGKLYFNEQQIEQAIASFQKATRLDPTNNEFLLDYVSAKFYQQHFLDREDKQLIAKLLIATPNNLNAINLLALDAYQQQNYAQAIRHWETLLQFFPTESEDSKNLLQMIRQAQMQFAKPGIAITKITVAVSLAPELQSKVSANDSLFVYALEKDGPKIPLAAVKLRAEQLPMTISLDKSNSMVPGRNIDSVEKVYVAARISKSGNAMPVAGDLIGESAQVNTKSKAPLNIMINKVIF